MKSLFHFLFLSFLVSYTYAQQNIPETFGFKHLQTLYKKDTVDILVLSKKGEENNPKPLFLFIQGSLPVPLIIIENNQPYSTFPFNTDSLIQYFHLAIINKPYIPIICDRSKLSNNFNYIDSNTKKSPVEYQRRNLLNYYVDRDIVAIKFLQKHPWIDKNKLIVAGHSEGSTIAAKLASVYKKVTHLIYSSGNPLGRIMSIIAQARAKEKYDSIIVEKEFMNWNNIVYQSNYMDLYTGGDTYKATFQFSFPAPIQYLQKLRIPVLINYGTKDATALFNDYFRLEMIRQQKKNFSFKVYTGWEHNFFGLKPNGEIDYDNFNWDKVALDWLDWLQKN